MKLSFPEGTFQGEEHLIKYLAKPQGTQQSVLQQCNDGGDIIYVQHVKMEDGKQVFDERGNPIIVPAEELRYERMKREIKNNKVLSFVSFDSFCDMKVFPVSPPEVKSVVFVVEMDNGALVLLGENMLDEKKGLVHQRKVKEVVSFMANLPELHRESMVMFVCEDRSSAKALRDELMRVVDGEMILKISGMDIPRTVVEASTRLPIVRHDVLVNEFRMYVDKFNDVKEIIPKINSWEDVAVWRDLGTGQPFYDREVNELLMYNVCYVKMGRAVFNLVLSGVPGSSKTSCATEYARIYEDTGTIMQAQGSTTKGLLPSFSGDKPVPGYLSSPGFLKVVDELFRHVSTQHENSKMNRPGAAIGEYLSRLLPILTRREQLYTSAKDNTYKAVMRSALLACDNLNNDVRVGLSTRVEQDPAVLRRLTIIYLSQEEWERVKKAKLVPADDEVHDVLRAHWKSTYGYDVEKLKRFAQWFRREVMKITVEALRCHDIARNVLAEMLRDELPLGALDEKTETRIQDLTKTVDFVDHVRALVECSALMRAVYAKKDEGLPHNVAVEEVDYADAERIFRRIIRDCMTLFRSYLVAKVQGPDEGVPSFGGVKRV